MEDASPSSPPALQVVCSPGISAVCSVASTDGDATETVIPRTKTAPRQPTLSEKNLELPPIAIALLRPPGRCSE